MKRWVIVAVLAAAVGWWCSPPRERSQPDGVLVPDVPEQVAIDSPVTFAHGDFQVMPLADFRITARVLSRETYRFDAGAAISPIDLALGWGAMSNNHVLEQLDVSQGSRWFTYRWGREGPPIPPGEIQVSASNMHMIPADGGVEAALRRIRRGDVVRIQGQLVEVSRSDGWRWRSSLTREDSGGGACELVYVRAIQVL